MIFPPPSAITFLEFIPWLRSSTKYTKRFKNFLIFRNLPLAILIGLPLVTVCYFFMNIAYFTVASIDEIIEQPVAIVSRKYISYFILKHGVTGYCVVLIHICVFTAIWKQDVRTNGVLDAPLRCAIDVWSCKWNPIYSWKVRYL